MSRTELERERSQSFGSLYVLYPVFVWAGPPLVAAGAVTGLICLV